MGRGGQHYMQGASSPQNSPDTHCKGGWVGPRGSLDGYGEEKSVAVCPRWGSSPEPSSP
jgi:hypothetical protein